MPAKGICFINVKTDTGISATFVLNRPKKLSFINAPLRPKNKPFGRHYCRSMTTAFHNSTALYDKVYKELRASDFIDSLKESKKKSSSQRQMVNLYLNLDKFALEEDIIDKGYAQFIPTISTKKEIKKAKNKTVERERVFSYEQIYYLWNLQPRSNGRQKDLQQE